jgi:hypothetical protein
MSAERTRVDLSRFTNTDFPGVALGCHPGCCHGLVHAELFIFTREQTDMVYVLTKKSTKRQFDAVLKRTARRGRKRKGVDFSDLVGTAPLHEDPVKFFRALRNEE